MRKLAQSAARVMRRAISNELKKYRRKALESDIAAGFRRLESRRVLTVNGTFDAATGVLNVSIDSSGETTAVLRQDGSDTTRFFLDENNDGNLGTGEVGGLKVDLKHLNVLGTGGSNIGTFRWSDSNPDAAPVLYDLTSITINNLQTVQFQTRASIEQNSSISVSDSIAFESIATGNELTFEGNLTLAASGPASQIVTGINARLDVDGLADFTANTINVGGQTNDLVQFGSLHFDATGDVTIHQDSAMVLVSLGTDHSSGSDIVLSSSSSILMATGSQIQATGSIELDANGGDVTLTRLQATGNITVSATGNILDGDSGVDDLDIDSQANVSLTSDDGSIGSTTSNIFLADTGVNSTNPLEVTSGGGYSASASNGMIALDIGEVNDVTVSTNTLWIQSTGDINVGTIPIGLLSGKTSLALIADVDGNSSGTLQLPNTITVTQDLRLSGADVTAADGSIDITANRVMFNSIFAETIAVDAAQLDASTSSNLTITSVNDLALVDLNDDTTAVHASGTLVVHVTAGSLTVQGTVRNSGAQGLLLQADGDNGDIIVQALVSAFRGPITLLANRDIIQETRGDVLVSLGNDLTNNTIYARAVTGSITMSGFASSATQGGNIDYRAAGDVTVVLLNAGTGGIWIDAGGSILDARGDTVGVGAEGFATRTGEVRVANLVANTAVLQAGGSIGIAGNPIDTSVVTLASDSGTSTYIFESDSLVVGSITASSVLQVNPNSTTTVIPTDALSGSDGGGHVKIETVDGNLTISAPVTAGLNILLAAGGNNSDLAINAPVNSTNGAITLLAQRNITQAANGDLLISAGSNTTTNTIYARAVDGSITMNANASSTTQGGNIYYRAAGSVTVGVLNAGSGGIWIDAGGSILDAQNDTVNAQDAASPGFAIPAGTRVVNLIASTATLQAGGSIGQPVDAGPPAIEGNPIDTSIGTLSSDSGTSTYVYQSGDLIIGSIASSSVLRVNLDSSTTAISTNALSGVDGGDHVKIETVLGNLTVNSSVTAGLNILLAAGGTNRDLAINAPVTSTNGAITLLAQRNITQGANGDLTITTGTNATTNTIYARAVAGSITMDADARSTTQGGNIYYRAAGSVTVGVLNAGSGGIWIDAGGSILDAQGDTVGVGAEGFANQTGTVRVVNLIASTAALNAGGSIGVAGNPIDTSIGTLASDSGTSTYIYESDALTVGSIAASSVLRVNLNSTTTAIPTFALSGSEGGDHVKIETIDGNLTIDAPVSAGLNILLAAGGTNRDLAVNTPVTSTNGAITLLAQRNITQGANGDLLITTSNNTTTNTIYARAVAGSITMNADASSTTQGGNIYYRAEGSVTVGVLNAGSGGIWIDAGGSILDAQNDIVNAQDAALPGFAIPVGTRVVNLIASTAALNAGGSIGVAGNPIDTSIGTLASDSGTSTYIYESDALTVGGIAASSVQRVNLNSTTTVIPTFALSGSEGGDHVKIETIDGNLTIDAPVTAGLNILLAAGGTNRDLAVNAPVTSTNGAITSLAQRNISQGVNGDLLITTGANRLTNTIYSYAVDGSITMDADARSTTQGGNIYYRAPADVIVGVLNAGNGGIWIDAGGSILDAQNDIVNAQDAALPGFAVPVGTRVVNLIASTAALSAGGSIGVAGNPIDTSIGTLASDSGTSTYIYESDALTVGSIAASSVQRVNLNSTTEVIPTGALSGSEGGDHVKIETIDGNLTIDAPVTAGLNILLAAGGTNRDLAVNAPVTSTNGAITLLAQRNITQGANGDLLITTGNDTTTNTIYAYAVAGSITMNADASSTTQGGNIFYRAAGNVTVGVLNAGNGGIWIDAGGNILDAQVDTVGVGAEGFATETGSVRVENLIASTAALQAGGSIGQPFVAGSPDTAGNPIDTRVGVLASNSGQSTYIYETNELTIGSIAASSVQRVNLNSTNTVIPTGALSGSEGGGHVKIETINGDLSVNAPVSAGSDVLLAAGGIGTVRINAPVTATTGHITILSNQGFEFSNQPLQTTQSLVVYSGADVTLGLDFYNFAHNLAIIAGRDIYLKTINANGFSVALIAGRDIIDTQNDTVGAADRFSPGFAIQTGEDRVVNLIANDVFLQAGRDIGQTANPIDTTINTLVSQSGRNTYIYETNALIVGNSASSIATRVNLNSTRTDIPADPFSGSVGGGHVKIETIDGSLTVDASVSAVNNILLAAGGVDRDLGINASVTSTNGAITLLAQRNITQGANGDLTITAGTNATTNTIYARAVAGSITMNANASSTTQGGNIYYRALGNVTVGVLNAGSGGIWIDAGGSILDAQNDTVSAQDAALPGFAIPAGTRVVNLIASTAALNAGGSIGVAGNPIDTSIAILASQSGTSTYVYETDDLTVGSIDPSSVLRVNLDSTTAVIRTTSKTDNLIWVHDNSGFLGTVDLETGITSVIGNMGVVLTDIAIAQDGTLYGISFTDLYQIDPITAAATFIGAHGIPDGNSLVFGKDGTLYAAGQLNTLLYTIDIATGASTSIGDIGFVAAGDLAFSGSELFLSTTSNQLVQIDLANNAQGIVVGNFGFSNVLGLATAGDGTLYGVTGTTVLSINTATGAGNPVLDFGGFGLGTSFGSSFQSEALPGPTIVGVQAGEHVKIETIDGNLTVNESVSAGLNILLAAGGDNSDLAINVPVTSTNGAITLLAQRNIAQGANGDLLITTGNNTTTNTIYAYAVDGSITMNANASSTTQGGNIYYRASGNVTVGVLNAGNGGIWIDAGGSILDAQSDSVNAQDAALPGFAIPVGTRVVNLIASTAALSAGGSIGQSFDAGPPEVQGNPLDTSVGTLATQSGTSTYIYETNDLVIGSIAAGSVSRVNLNSTNTGINTEALAGSAGGQHVKIETINGSLTVDASVSAGNNILLASGGVDRDLAVNAPVTSTNGAITLLAQRNITQGANGDLTITTGSSTTTNTIYAYAVDGSITMDANASSTTQGGNIYYRAAGSVTVGFLNAGSGGIWIDAGGSILDAQNDTVSAQDAALPGFAIPVGTRVVNLIASTAALNAGGSIGIAGNPIDTSVGTLASDSGTSTYIYESDALTVGSVAASSVLRVNLNSTTTVIPTFALSGSEGGGNVKIETIDGNLTVNSSVTAGLNILLAAGGTNRDLTINVPVTSTNGAITLLAQRNITQGANGDLLITTGNNTTTNTIYAYAVDGSITMNADASSTTQGGNIYYRAAGSVTVGVLNAGSGGIWIDAGGSILDAQNDTVDAQDAALPGFAIPVGARVVNLFASTAALSAGGSIGVAGNPIDTSIGTLASDSGTSTYIYETDDLTVGSIAASSVQRVNLNSTTTVIPTFALSGSEGGGNVKIETIDGNLNVNGSVTAGLNILLAAGGTNRDLAVNAPVTSTNGAITLLAQRNITQGANGDLLITTGNNTTTNTIYAYAVDGSITMNADASSTTQGGNIYYRAAGSVTVGVLNAGNGGIWIDAGGSILDAQNDTVSAQDAALPGFAIPVGTRVVNLIASTAALSAGGSIGQSFDAGPPEVQGNPLDTSVGTLATQSGTSTYIYETNDLVIGSIAASSVSRVNLNSTNTVIPTGALSGSTGGGHVKIETIDGNLTVNAPVDAGLNILLAAGGANRDLAVNAPVTSTNGAITLLAQRNISQAANGDLLIETGADRLTNTIYTYAVTGSITMDANALSTTQGGNIYYRAETAGRDVTVGVLRIAVPAATLDDGIWITAGRNILDAQNDTVGVGAEGFAIQTGVARVVNLFASTAVLQAGGSIGVDGNPIDTSIGILASQSGTSTYIYESDDLVVDSVAASSVQRVNLNSTNTTINTEALAGSAGGGHVKIETINGDLTVNRPVTAGLNILLAAGGVDRDLAINAPVTSTNGAITLLAQRNISQGVNGDLLITTGANRLTNTIYAYAVDGLITMDADARSTTQGGNIYYRAAVDVTVGILEINEPPIPVNGGIWITAGRNILDAQGDTVGVDADGFATQTGDARVENLIARNAVLRADTNMNGTGSIGTVGNPLDTLVGTLASKAREGTYIYETDSLIIGTIADSTVTRVHLNSTQVNFPVEGLNGINNAADDIPVPPSPLPTGHVKIETINGNLTVDANAPVFARANTALPLPARNTDILLAAGGAAGNLTLNSPITTDWGAITLLAQQNIFQNNAGDVSVTAVSTPADTIDRVRHSIYARAVDGSITMGPSASSTTQGGNIYYRAPGNVTLGTLAAGSGGVWVNAGGSILDAQNDTVDLGNAGFETATGDPRVVNIRANTAVLQAGGTIGIEGNPIDTEVRIVAGASTNGIFLRESNALVVGYVGASNVERVHLRSDTLEIPVGALWGLTTINGPIRVLTQQNDLFIDGTINAGGGGGANDITLIAQSGAIEQRPGTRMTLTSDANLGANTLSVADTSMFTVGMRIGISDSDSPQQIVTVTGIGAGTIQINSGLAHDIQAETSNLYQFHNLASSASAGATTLNVADSSAFTVGMRIAVWDADSAQRIYTITAVAPGTIQLDSGLTDAINAATSRLFPLQARVAGDDLWMKAGMHAHIHDASVAKLFAQSGANRTLDLHEHVNVVASNKGDDFLVNLEVEIPGLTISDTIKQRYRFAEHYASQGYSLYVVNDRMLSVDNVTAGAAEAPNIYVETLGAHDIVVDGTVRTVSTMLSEGGIILVAGDDLTITPNKGRLETYLSGNQQVVLDAQIETQFFRYRPTSPIFYKTTGQAGIGNDLTTGVLLRDIASNIPTVGQLTDNGPRHIKLQIAIQFGDAGERGFESFIAYGDGKYGYTDGNTPTNVNELKIVGLGVAGNPATPLDAQPIDGDTTGLFVRQVPFSEQFFDEAIAQEIENHATLRRANDFFLFQKAASSEANIADMTVQSEQINVITGIAPGGQPILPPPLTPAPAFFVPVLLLENKEPLNRIDSPEIEFVTIAEAKPDVLLYKVDYKDDNENGQPDDNELPQRDEVLEQVKDGTAVKKNFPDDKKPTPPIPQAEINNIKSALQSDPEAPVGAYAIIQENTNKSKEVLEIFPVRDSADDKPPTPETIEWENDPVVQPPANSEDGAFYLPSRLMDDESELQALPPEVHSRNSSMQPSTSLAVMLGALGLRASRQRTQSNGTDSGSESFGRHARRQRRRQSLLQALQGQSNGEALP